MSRRMVRAEEGRGEVEGKISDRVAKNRDGRKQSNDEPASTEAEVTA